MSIRLFYSNRQRYGVIVSIILCTFIIWAIFLTGMVKIEKYGTNGKEMSTDSVEQRLLQSHENWLRSLEYRKNLEVLHPLDSSNQWSFFGGVSFWDFFYPSFDCPHTSERIGRSGDGGKWICGFHEIAKHSEQHSCIVYSYGISYEWSFDAEILRRSNCSVYMFDPTIETRRVPLPKLYPNRAFIEQMGLGINDTANLTSLKTQMKKYGHDFIDILKMDIEGPEFYILTNMKDEFPSGPPFGQLAVELHLPSNPETNLYAKLKKWMLAMEKMGLRPFRNEINLGAVKSSIRHTPHCWEYSFINVKFDHHLLHSSSE